MTDRAFEAERLHRLAQVFPERWQGRDGIARGMAEYILAAESEANAAGEQPVACRAGCPCCCVLNVTVLLPEAAAIAAWLDERLSPPERALLISRLERQRRLVRWMEDGERIRTQIHCPFLDRTGSCSVYPVRPLVCRGVTSLDRDLCRETLDPTAEEVGGAVPADMARRMVMDAAFCALGRALQESGAPSRGIELSAGVWALLAFPEMVDQLKPGGTLPQELWDDAGR